jgi:hypothetical protein
MAFEAHPDGAEQIMRDIGKEVSNATGAVRKQHDLQNQPDDNDGHRMPDMSEWR